MENSLSASIVKHAYIWPFADPIIVGALCIRPPFVTHVQAHLRLHTYVDMQMPAYADAEMQTKHMHMLMLT